MRAAEIERLLPEVIRRTVVDGSPMAAMLAVMEAMHAPAEKVLAGLPTVFDPLRTPERFVSMLARWVDLERLDLTEGGRLEPERMRLLVAAAALLARRRGTWPGLLQVLEIATGHAGFTVEDTGPFRVLVTVPTSAAGQLALVRALVEQEKPAHLVADVRAAETEEPSGPPDAGPSPAPGTEAGAGS